MPKTRPGRLLKAIAVIALLLPASARAAAQDEPTGSAWLVEWDFKNGVDNLRGLGNSLSAVQVFAASFDREDRPVLAEELRRNVADNAFPLSGQEVFLSVVNDAEGRDGKTILKDPELITRLLATKESRDRHLHDLTELADSGGYAGLDIDYEQIRDKDWPAFKNFMAELSRELAARGKRVRVVLEPNPRFYREPLPEGPEYVVMAYNLFGGHSGPGPKANPTFLAKLAAQLGEIRAKARLALSTGGFDWPSEGRVTALTENAAFALAAKHDARVGRDVDSRYLHFTYSENGIDHTVWYADAITLQHLIRTGKRLGFETFDIWRLGGLSAESVKVIAQESKAAAVRSGRVLTVGPGNQYRTINSAVQIARPGDRIEIAPGEYHESVRVDRPGLTIAAQETPVPADRPPTVRVVAPKDKPAVHDTANTVWRHVAFTGSSDILAALENFTGSFEYCHFLTDSGRDDGTAVAVYEGAPTFHGCTIRGRAGYGVMVNSFPTEPAQPAAFADLTYTIVEGFAEAAISVTEQAAARLANCVVARNGLVAHRGPAGSGDVEIVNSIIYNNHGLLITNSPGSAPAIRFENCLSTPLFNSMIWAVAPQLSEQPGVLAKNCRVLSPRFVSSGRPTMLNLGIDDTINLGVFEDIVRESEKYGYLMTFSVNTNAMTEDDWPRVLELYRRKHEIAAHSAGHVGVETDIPMAVGRALEDYETAFVSIVPGDKATMEINGKIIGSFPLTDKSMTLQLLAQQLERYGFITLVSHVYANLPVIHLEAVENLDVAFTTPAAPLYLKTEGLLESQIDEPFTILKSRLPAGARIPCVNPFVVTSPLSRRRMFNVGYSCARAMPPLDHEDDGKPRDSIIFNTFTIPCVSFNTANYTNDGDRKIESFLLALDYAKERMGAISFYSHTYQELTLDQWKEVLELVAEDPNLVMSTLNRITAEVVDKGQEINDNYYQLPLPKFEEDFRLRDDSPARNSGKPIGLAFDFAGNPVPTTSEPNIGLYQ